MGEPVSLFRAPWVGQLAYAGLHDIGEPASLFRAPWVSQLACLGLHG